MVIKIGTVETLSVENWKVIPDDRQSTQETIGGIIVQDFGRVPEGDKFSCTVTVWNVDADIIFDYWNNRILVDVIDEAGKLHKSCRVVVKEYSYIQHFGNCYTINLEFWRL